ncbi:MAG: T9SS type A sorting domain-containing protein [Saprospiraceae bacterium]|nr:T9SS type A sorting domain-containing protein [Candidatus Defluviibacterium haderslevense]
MKDLCCLQLDIQVDTQLIKIINTQINPRFNSKHLAIHSGHVSQIFLDANLIGLPNLLADEVVFSIEVEALKVTSNSNLAFSISDVKTKSIAYDIHGNPLDISLNNKVNAQTNIQQSENIILYPNPMNDQLTIQWKESLDDSFIEIYNSNGKLCFKSKFKSDIILSENNFTGPGMYFLKCTKGNKMITKKIIKL